MPTLNRVISGTDWELLSRQKAALVRVLMADKRLTKETKVSFDGLLNWIDAIQEAASNEGFPVVWLGDDC